MNWKRRIPVALISGLLIQTRITVAWNFLTLNTTNEDVTILHASVFYYRVFLSIKSDLRNVQSELDNNCPIRNISPAKDLFLVPTLVESTWPESIFSSVQAFPNKRSHHLSQRSTKSCRKLVQSYRTTVDGRGNLWILDNGAEYCDCGPKLIILSLNFFNQEVSRKYFNNCKSNSFTDMIIETGAKQNATRAFLSVKNKDYILSYSLATSELKKLKIQPSHCDSLSLKPISIEAMTLTGTSGRNGGGQALIYDHIEKRLYYLDLRIGRSQGHLHAIQLGYLLGRIHSMTVDPDEFLYYITDRDGAAFRWNMKTELMAENHQVLHFQTTEAAQILIGPQGTTWVINEKPIDELDLMHSQKILSHYSR